MPSESQQDYWKHWYESPTDTSALLRQGDVFRNLVVPLLPQDLPVIPVPPAEAPKFEWEAILGDWIVFSASCDVENRIEYGYALLGHVVRADATTLNTKTSKELDQKLEVIRRGNDPLRFLLPACPEIEPAFPLSIVQYRKQAVVPLKFLRASCTSPRLRLKPPFREKFGNWAGGGLSRVGIEDDTNIPPFVGNLYAAQILKATSD